jgi:hypothetical protein
MGIGRGTGAERIAHSVQPGASCCLTTPTPSYPCPYLTTTSFLSTLKKKIITSTPFHLHLHLLQLAMINIHCKLAELSHSTHCTEREHREHRLFFRRSRSYPGAGLYRLLDDVRPVLQVHDELLFEARTKDVPLVAAIMQECMQNAVGLQVPLAVKVSWGDSWGSLAPLTHGHTEAQPQRTQQTQQTQQTQTREPIEPIEHEPAPSTVQPVCSSALGGHKQGVDNNYQSLFSKVVGNARSGHIPHSDFHQEAIYFNGGTTGAHAHTSHTSHGAEGGSGDGVGVQLPPPIVRALFGRD